MVVKKIVSCIVWCCFFGVSAQALHAQNVDRLQEQWDDTRTRNRVHELVQVENFDELEAFVGECEQQWKAVDRTTHATRLLDFCNIVSSKFYHENQPYILMQQWIRSALESAGHLPLEVEAELLYKIAFLDRSEQFEGGFPENAWLRRDEKVLLWLKTWQRLQNEIDRDWDEDDLPRINIMPPEAMLQRAGNFMSGMSPEAIEDPEVRAAYEAAIEKNEQKAREYSKQSKLRKLEKYFVPKLEQYLAFVYSASPSHVEELEKYLEEYVTDERLRTRILKAIKQNIIEK